MEFHKVRIISLAVRLFILSYTTAGGQTPPSYSDVTDGCGVTKGCFIADSNLLVTYVEASPYITFELYSTLGQWVAVGYSYDQYMVCYGY